MDKKENLILWEPMNVGSGGSYSGVVGPTIYEIGWTEDFVIAKTHPNLSHLLNNGASSDFLSDSELAVIRDSSCYIFRTIEDQRDSSKYDPKKTFKRNDKWWSELYQVRLADADSLMPFKKLTYWHIVEIKKSNKVFTATSEEAFNNEKKRLNIPDTLSFFLKFEDLK